MMQKKSQAATEALMVLAGALIVLLVLFVVNSDVMGSVNARLRYTKAKVAVNDIGDAAELVYQQGVGSKTKVYLSLPSSIDNSTVSGRTVSIRFKASGETVYRNLGFNVTGTIPTEQGFYWVCLESTGEYVSVNACQD